MTEKPERTVLRSSLLRIFLPAFALIAAMSVLWSLASPIFSSPDESAHATKAIAQLRGEVVGHELKGLHFLVVDLPSGYRYSEQMMCFAYNSGQPADCGAPLGSPGGTPWFSTWVGAYNPLYYEVVGWPSLFLNGSQGVYGMRIVSALLSAALLAWAFQAAFASRRVRWIAAGVAFLASPVILYMAGSVNPQGLEISSAAALWIGLIRLVETFDSDGDGAGAMIALPRSYLWVIVAVSGSFLATARATGPLWVVIVVLAVFTIVGWRRAIDLFRRPLSYLPIAIIAASGIYSVAWTLIGGSLSGQASKSDAPAVGGSFFFGAWLTLRSTPHYVEEAVGVFGWLDTYLPVFVYVIYFVAFALIAVLAITATRRRGLIAMAVVIGLAVLVPAVVQGYSVHQTGLIWQGRYGIFLYIAIPLVGAWLLSGPLGHRVAFLSVRFSVIIASLLGLYSIAAFVLVLRRYVIGSDTPISRMVTNPLWQPPFGWTALVVAFGLVAILFTAWIIRLSVVTARADDREVDVARRSVTN